MIFAFIDVQYGVTTVVTVHTRWNPSRVLQYTTIACRLRPKFVNTPKDRFRTPNKVGTVFQEHHRPSKQSSYIHVDGSPITRPIVGIGMTRLILLIDDAARVRKVPKLYSLKGYEDKKRDYTHFGNQDNCEIFQERESHLRTTVGEL